jgi:protoheme IX farnesyltransferase
MSKNQRAPNIVAAYVDLLRMRILVMVMVACAIGYIMADHGQFDPLRFTLTLLGTGMMSGASCALNCYFERDLDALMPRTSQRPIPAGMISPRKALVFGALLLFLGGLILFTQINILAGILGLTATFVYLVIYTPAKRYTWLNTSIGAIPGAIPPLIGWAAATGQVSAGGWILFTMLFFWQHTHFFPIAWLYKEDYKKGGFKMLPVLELTGDKTFRLTVASAICLLPISLLLFVLGSAGYAYCAAATLCGTLLIAAGCKLAKSPSRIAARNVLLLSVFYLPVILATVILDRYGANFGTHFLSWLETVWRWT